LVSWNGTGKIGRVNSHGAVKEFRPPVGFIPYSMACASDGNIWVGNVDAASLLRVTPTGQMKEFAIPSGHAAYYIAAGPDGKMWITQYSVGRIAKFNPIGVD
jgi:virginiamycin B lyase